MNVKYRMEVFVIVFSCIFLSIVMKIKIFFVIVKGYRVLLKIYKINDIEWNRIVEGKGIILRFSDVMFL